VSFAPPGRPTSPPQDGRGLVLGPDDGAAYWWLGTLSITKLSGDRTAGGLDIVEHRVAPGYAPPRHTHVAQDEVFYILDGDFQVVCGDDSWPAGPGSLVFLPRGVPHGFTVGDSPGRALLFNAPAGFADLIADLGQPAPSLVLPPEDAEVPGPEEIAAASRARGIKPA
jgi:mannose-6-phosphate isomerase-like protein (cupin superfamily)